MLLWTDLWFHVQRDNTSRTEDLNFLCVSVSFTNETRRYTYRLWFCGCDRNCLCGRKPGFRPIALRWKLIWSVLLIFTPMFACPFVRHARWTCGSYDTDTHTHTHTQIILTPLESWKFILSPEWSKRSDHLHADLLSPLREMTDALPPPAEKHSFNCSAETVWASATIPTRAILNSTTNLRPISSGSWGFKQQSFWLIIGLSYNEKNRDSVISWKNNIACLSTHSKGVCTFHFTVIGFNKAAKSANTADAWLRTYRCYQHKSAQGFQSSSGQT